MAKEPMIVDEIEGDDVNLDEPERVQRRTVTRVETPPPRKVQPKVVTMADWPRIMLEENDNIPPIGLFIGVNGVSYILRPGLEVAVPPGVVDVLNNAIMTTAKLDPQTLQNIGWRDKLRFPYRLLRAQAA